MFVTIVVGVGAALVSSVATWAVLRNNPRFLYRGLEAKLREELNDAIAKGKMEAKEALDKVIDWIT